MVLPYSDPSALLGQLRNAHIPVVLLEHELRGVSWIAIEEYEGGRVSTQHLLDLGHRRIALLRQIKTSTLSQQRTSGYRAALEAAGLSYDESLVLECDGTQADGDRITRDLLHRPQAPTAIFAHNDLVAQGVYHAAQSAGLRIPEDLSVVGYDDISTSAYMAPPLTTVRFPKAEMGRLAGELVLALLKAELNTVRTITLPVQLIVRQSTAVPKTAD